MSKLGDEVIMFTTKELEVIDSAIDGFNWLSNSDVNPHVWVMTALSLLFCGIGFFSEFKKNSNIKRVIKSYKTTNERPYSEL
mmetsp:Transcript_6283/g.3527  ORF Transcript_6283/g.3527 Transcript_6283/m.3527 type:complete len:82 (+) Transcript_6283:74-319(+)